MDWNRPSLKVLNLVKTETAVLNTLVQPKTVQDIAKDSAVSRTGTNHILKNLIAKGYVSYQLKGKRRLYSAVTPEQLSQKIELALNEVESFNPEKRGVKVKSKKDEFSIHVGAKEIIPAYKRIAFENKNERIRAIQHHRSWLELIEKITPKQLVAFNQAIVKNHLILDGMLNESAYKAYQEEIKADPEKHTEAVKSLEGRMADYSVFPDEFFNYDAEIWIFKRTTLVINWHEEFAIEIINENMTGFFRDMFEFVKAGARKLNHEKALQESLNDPLKQIEKSNPDTSL